MILPQTHLNIVMLKKDLFATAKAITLETRQRFVTLSEVEELFRLVISIFRSYFLLSTISFVPNTGTKGCRSHQG